MKHIINLAITFAILLPATAWSQNEADALHLSQTQGAATARALSLGGAGGSFGGDFSSVGINPATLGMYRSSEFMVTPTLRFNSMNGNYLGSSTSTNNSKFNFSNVGIVFSTAKKGEQYQRSDWKSVNIGIGYNRVADFNTKSYYAGNNNQSSMTEAFSADARLNGIGQNMIPPFGFLAYNSYLLNNDTLSIPYENIIKNGGSLDQSKTWKTGGGINEWNFSIGGNYREKLIIGASANLTSYKYNRSITYNEADATGITNNDFDKMYYSEDISTTGIGFNLKLGAIYKINDWVRFGAAFHTPTWSAFSDVSDYTLTNNAEGYSGVHNITIQPDQPYAFDYSMRSPWKAVFSGTFMMGQYGFITADYELVDYTSMRYNFTSDINYENLINNAIQNTYKTTHNIRVGVEGKLENFSGRLGFAYTSSPYQNASTFKGDRMDLSLGLGARFDNVFIDLAYIITMNQYSEYGYPLLAGGNAGMGIRKVPVGMADVKQNRNVIALTLGFKF
jgi:hypothetical protein